MELTLPHRSIWMCRKSTLAHIVFFIALILIISPWIVERRFLFNEIIAVTGISILAYKRFRIGNDVTSAYILALLAWCGVHVLTSLFRMDSIYYYLRNMVIVYSIFTYFIGYYLFKYLDGFLKKFGQWLGMYITVLLLFPLSNFLFERFGMATLFPALFRYLRNRLMLPVLIVMNIIYSVTYDSATIILLTACYLLLWISPGYRFFKQVIMLMMVAFAIFFIAVQPNLALISNRFSPYNDNGIIDVRTSNPILAVDPNSTWRLILWKEIAVDQFPANIFGLGLGTPVFKYFPVEDYSKVAQLPYILGAHNSFVYLFGRLGIIYILLTVVVYKEIFREYFYYKPYYYKSKTILIFWSFIAISVTAVFNPVLESPIFSGIYWLILGLLGRAIAERKKITRTAPGAPPLPAINER